MKRFSIAVFIVITILLGRFFYAFSTGNI